MSNRDKLIAALAALPEYRGQQVNAHTPATKVFTPDAAATWFLCQREGNPDEVRYFGLCDLGLGFPELGYVDHTELLQLKGRFGLPVELDEWFDGNLADGYRQLHLSVPDWLIPNEVTT